MEIDSHLFETRPPTSWSRYVDSYKMTTISVPMVFCITWYIYFVNSYCEEKVLCMYENKLKVLT
jgi:hypothetical protein